MYFYYIKKTEDNNTRVYLPSAFPSLKWLGWNKEQHAWLVALMFEQKAMDKNIVHSLIYALTIYGKQEINILCCDCRRHGYAYYTVSR